MIVSLDNCLGKRNYISFCKI